MIEQLINGLKMLEVSEINSYNLLILKGLYKLPGFKDIKKQVAFQQKIKHLRNVEQMVIDYDRKTN